MPRQFLHIFSFKDTYTFSFTSRLSSSSRWSFWSSKASLPLKRSSISISISHIVSELSVQDQNYHLLLFMEDAHCCFLRWYQNAGMKPPEDRDPGWAWKGSLKANLPKKIHSTKCGHFNTMLPVLQTIPRVRHVTI